MVMKVKVSGKTCKTLRVKSEKGIQYLLNIENTPNNKCSNRQKQESIFAIEV